jgi:phospholipid transport system transporter-binding protein
VLALPATLTLNEAAACGAQLSQAIRTHDGIHVVIEAAALQRFDSAALAVLLDCRRVCEENGKRLAVTGTTPRLQALASLYGIAELLIDT